MNKTANFQLTQWEKTDRIMMEDFNRDNAAIDAALKANADEVAALQTALAGAGNCSIETQSYTGNGKYGQNNPNSITFSKKPKAVLIFGNRFFWLLTDSGAVVKNLNSDKVANALFPLPPLAEQHRIVQRIEELLPLVKGL